MLIVGIDPGKTGGIVALADTGVIKEMAVMPDSVDGIAMHLLNLKTVYKDEPEGIFVFLEKAFSMGSDGAWRAFTYGTHFGSIIGILTAYMIPHDLVHPKTWQKPFHVSFKDRTAKARSLLAARRLYPGQNFLRTPRCTKPHEGIVDALLIAEYGRRHLRFPSPKK